VADDLTAPLGKDKKPKRRLPIGPFITYALTGLLCLSLGSFIIWAAVIDDPLGGEPVAMIEVAPLAPGGGQQQAQQRPSSADAPAAGNQTITIIDGSSGKREEVTIPAAVNATPAGNANAPEPKQGATAGPNARLSETSRHGVIPKIGPDGSRPSDVYAQPVKASAQGDLPRIAIILGGLGVGSNNTSDAFAKLPAGVTFAFAPYSANLDQLATRARDEGHEVLLQVPMEPFDYPDNDPGPQTLLTTIDAGQNIDRLHWLMSRFSGYVGVTNYMGARFTASEQSLAPVLRETAKRGLIYVDDGSSPRSLASQIAGANNLPFAKADVVIDAVPSNAEIDRALTRLENTARERGVAVGTATALPVAIERIAKWAKTAEGRGYLIVPITATATSNRAKSS
jgi:polysaccharide deacetylase 2 family uncharacterized protein YibQ